MNTLTEFIVIVTDVFDNNLGFTTLIVGFIAYLIYEIGKKDAIREAALLITQEVRFAEDRLRISKRVNLYPFEDKFLPTNSWNKNIHMFAKILKPNELDLISKFYSTVEYIDLLVSLVSSINNDPNYWKDFLQTSHILKTENLKDPDNLDKFKLYLELLSNNCNVNITAVSNKVELIFNTPVCTKLQRIAEGRWYKPLF